MKCVFSLCSLLFAVSLSAQNEKADSNFHIYLLIGQSNMAGRGAVDTESKKIHPRILMLDIMDRWVPATDPVHFDKPGVAGVGPAISFAKEMLAGDPNVRIGLVPAAWGGSPIRVWEPGQVYLKTHPYDEAVRRTEIALQRGVLKGILWHQGESDNDSARASVYLQKLEILIGRLRTEFRQPALPFVAGELGYFLEAHFINNIIGQLPVRVSHTAVVSARDLTDRGDQVHFNTASARELGRRYARAMKQLSSSIEDH